ncbi:MAG: hypothetical protein CM15mP6_1620 [Methanobacteriota archaeon]|nr:MAG: hypothetical protein CM15mP6_1620 [Euryarchaeota archaeon]
MHLRRTSLNNILDKLSSTSDAFPDKIAFAFIRKGNKKKTDSISFRELDQKSDRAARYLSNRGFKDGLVTLVLARPSTDFVVLMYAMLKTGAVPLLLPLHQNQEAERKSETKKNPEQSQTRGGNRKRSLARNSQDSPSRTQKVEDNKRPKSEEILL